VTGRTTTNQRLQAAISKYFRYPRHLAALLRHAGVRKTANVLLVEAERLSRRTHLRGKPYYYFVDPCNVCNLRCPLCPTGTGDLARSRGLMSLAEYQVLLEKIAPYAVEVSLHNWGEPLLNKDIYDIIGLTSRRGIATNLSSNLSLDKPDLAERLVTSGLEYLIVSLDGVTQESYGEYRRRGDIKLVFDNLRAIVETRRRLKRKTPVIEWQFLVFPHNEHEMDAAREMAPRLGVDKLRFRSPGLPYEQMYNRDLQEKWMPTNPAYWDLHPGRLRKDGYLWDEPCYYLYRSMTVNPGGGVAACCIVYREAQDFGNLVRQDLDTIWNNRQYVASRDLFTRTGMATHLRAGTICDGCFLFKRHLGDRASRARGGAGRKLINRPASRTGADRGTRTTASPT
jgi:MoaA/NifB/PqqE/SkfB family radical SAM enzyme